MDIIFLDFSFHVYCAVRFINLPNNYSFLLFLDLPTLENLLLLFISKYHMANHVENQLTRQSQSHASYVTYFRATTYALGGGGGAHNNALGKACTYSRGRHWDILHRFSITCYA